jgi:hypothetical protein
MMDFQKTGKTKQFNGIQEQLQLQIQKGKAQNYFTHLPY